MTRRAALAALVVLSAAGCATGGKLRQGMAVVRADIDKAKRSGAQRCAPKELAMAEANVEFAEVETDYGHASRALEHVKAAYALAVRERFRFFSYGDCMLLA